MPREKGHRDFKSHFGGVTYSFRKRCSTSQQEGEHGKHWVPEGKYEVPGRERCIGRKRWAGGFVDFLHGVALAGRGGLPQRCFFLMPTRKVHDQQRGAFIHIYAILSMGGGGPSHERKVGYVRMIFLNLFFSFFSYIFLKYWDHNSQVRRKIRQCKPNPPLLLSRPNYFLIVGLIFQENRVSE